MMGNTKSRSLYRKYYFGIVWGVLIENNSIKVNVWCAELGDVSLSLKKGHSIRLGDWVSFEKNQVNDCVVYENIENSPIPDGLTVTFKNNQVVISSVGLVGCCADRENGIIWCDYFGRIQCKSSKCEIGLPEPLTAVAFEAVRIRSSFGSSTLTIGWKAIAFSPIITQTVLSGLEKSLLLVDDIVVGKLSSYHDYCTLSSDILATKLDVCVKSDFWFLKDEETDEETAIVSPIPLSGQQNGIKYDVFFCAPEEAMIISMRKRYFPKVTDQNFGRRNYNMLPRKNETKSITSTDQSICANRGSNTVQSSNESRKEKERPQVAYNNETEESQPVNTQTDTVIDDSVRMKVDADKALVDQLLSKHLSTVCKMCPTAVVQCMRVRENLAPK